MREITVSLVILTFHRWNVVNECLEANLASADYPLYEIIHVDNGSGNVFNEKFRDVFRPNIQIIHAENQGVSKGYNRGMLMASGTHIAIVGCDRLMPTGWLKTMVDATERIPNTGVVSHYSSPNHASLAGKLHQRLRGPTECINGVEITPAFACEARVHSRQFLKLAGFFREDLGLYGYEDVEWSERAERVARENNLINYILPNMPFAQHMWDEDDFKMPDGTSYVDFKEKENHDGKAEFVRKCWELGSPYYNPYW